MIWFCNIITADLCEKLNPKKSLNNLMFSSHPDPSKCPSEKEYKKHEAESDEFQRNSSGPASFFVAASTPCIPSTKPSQAPSPIPKKTGKTGKRLGL